MADTGLSDATWNAQQVADYLHVHVNTVRRLYTDEQLPFVRIGRAIRFRRADVDAWLAARVTTRVMPS